MKKHNLRKQSKLLVESILDKDPITANSIFQRLILEAEAAREEEVDVELGLDDTDTDTDTDVDDEESAFEEESLANEDEAEDDSEVEDFESDEFDTNDETISDISDEDFNNTVNDIIEINCQINAKVISNLFDKIANLKTQVISLNLEPTSREYLNYDIRIQYYSNKLQNLQDKTNPGIDQSKVEKALDKIDAALDELVSKITAGEDTDFDINNPDEVAAENELGDENDSVSTDETLELNDDQAESGDEEESIEDLENSSDSDDPGELFD